MNILSRLQTIENALSWLVNVPASEQLPFQKELVKLRREYKKTGFAIEERPSVAAFGESQMGKSYLVSAMLSSPNSPFSVTDGERSFHFIDEINPSAPNSTIEATGVITRFTTQDQETPKGHLKAQLLSVADIVLILCEAYYNQVDYSHESIISTDDINSALETITLGTSKTMHAIVGEDDIMDIREYLQTSSIQKKCHAQLSSNLFDFLLRNINQLSNEQLISIIKLVWNNNSDINRLFDDLISTYNKINYVSNVYVEFKSVLKKHGTLLDVARLDEMYAEPEVSSNEFINTANVLLDNGDHIELQKSFFSAIIAELTFSLPASTCVERDFLNHIDILDFPGSRRPEQIKEERLSEGKNLSTVLRRGKVSYLFNKYSKSKRITALLFCHNNNQSAESAMGAVLTEWINTNVGQTPTEREAFIKNSTISPLLIIGTWFNKDLDYQNETEGALDRLNERWQRRFNVVLEKEVLKSSDIAKHWFNEWTTSRMPFSSIFMLRDFKYSTTIFKGYNPETRHAEENLIVNDKYPTFIEDLRQSFISNPFVKAHFVKPEDAWDNAATVGNDGTKPIIKALCELAPHVALARAEKLQTDFNSLDKRIRNLLEQYYHPEDSDQQLKQAKKQAGEACLTIDKNIGQDPFFFGRLMGTLMISETELYELVHKQILGAELPSPMSSEEASIYMGAELDCSLSHEENISRLCDYLGADDEDDCKNMLLTQGIDIEKLLSQSRMLNSEEDNLVKIVEDKWHDDFLSKRCSSALMDKYAPIDTIIRKLWTLYKLLNIHDSLVKQVKNYTRNLSREECVSIIADYIAMQLNAFVNSFGFDFLPEVEQEKISSQNEKLHLGLNLKVLLKANDHEGLALLADLDKKSDLLSNNGGFSAEKRDFLLRFPQYKSIWQWQQKLRFGYAFACKLPNYDPVANSNLKKIISQIN